MEYEKKFIIIGSKNCITYKEIFPLIKDNKLWIGAKTMSGSLWFNTPNGYENINDKIINGEKLTPIACCWFTNIDHAKRHERIDTTYLYSKKDNLYPDLYPKYDNYDAINVDKTAEIPMDYDGIMGVPITFLDKYNSEQFEIIGISGDLAKPIMIEGKRKSGRFYIGNKRLYDRILIRKKTIYI